MRRFTLNDFMARNNARTIMHGVITLLRSANEATSYSVILVNRFILTSFINSRAYNCLV